MSKSSSGGEFLAGFLIGAFAGAAAALLFAPKSGEETRTIIRERGIELKDRAGEVSVEARRRAEEVQSQAKTKAQDLTTQAKGKAQDLTTQAKGTAQKLQTRVKQTIDEGKAAATRRKEDLLTEIEVEPIPDEPTL